MNGRAFSFRYIRNGDSVHQERPGGARQAAKLSALREQTLGTSGTLLSALREQTLGTSGTRLFANLLQSRRFSALELPLTL